AGRAGGRNLGTHQGQSARGPTEDATTSTGSFAARARPDNERTTKPRCDRSRDIASGNNANFRSELGEGHGAGSGADVGGEPDASFRSDACASFRSDTRASFGSDTRASFGSDARASFRRDAGAGFRGDAGASFRSDARASFRSDARASFRSDLRASFGSDLRASFRSGVAADFRGSGRSEAGCNAGADARRRARL